MPREMSSFDEKSSVDSWLKGAGLGRYTESFRQAGVTQEIFKKLLMQDYAKVGVEDLADKQKLFRLIKAVNKESIGYDSFEIDGENEENYSMAAENVDVIDLSSFGETDLLGEVMGSLSMNAHGPESHLCPTSPIGSGLAWGSNEESYAMYESPNHNHSSIDSVGLSYPLPSQFADPPRLRVVVRKRPLNRKEVSRREDDIVTLDSNTGFVCVHEPKTKVDLTRYIEQQKFNFDDVLDEDTTQTMVYETTVHPLIQTIFNKAKATCFAYGQTGSGKTYTMQPLPLRAVRDMFEKLQEPEFQDLHLWFSYFEIYGGKVYDLLKSRKMLPVREDDKKNVCIVGLQEHEVYCLEEVEELIEIGSATRSTGTTGANSDSSRSHAILQLCLKESPKARSRSEEIAAKHMGNQAESTNGKLWGKFSFIDLAGSERGADTTDNDKQTRIEGAEINKSLLALKECIRALDHDAKHVPFRGSKLTEVLRDSFIGDCRTVMIANISPASGSCEHTLNTLRYADRVKELRRNQSGAAAAPCSYFQFAVGQGAGNASVPQKQKRASMGNYGVGGGGLRASADRGAVTCRTSQAPASPQQPPSPEPSLAHLRKSLSYSNPGVPPKPTTRHATPSRLPVYPTAESPNREERRDIERERQQLELDRAQFEYERQQLEIDRANMEAQVNRVGTARAQGGPDAESSGGGQGRGSGDRERDQALNEAHSQLVSTILQHSEDLIATHRMQIEETMELVRTEVNLVAEIDQPGSAVDTYVQQLSEILTRKANSIADLQKKVTIFQRYLKEEEILAQSVQ